MNDFLKVLAYGGVFAVPFLTLFVQNDYFFPFITGKNFAFRIIVEVAFVAWALLAVLDVRYRPKFSWILSSFSLLLIVMFFANLFGEHPATSFWSNFERMDGYVTLVHVFLYTVVVGSILTTKQHWSFFLHGSLLAAFITALYGLAQYSGAIEGYNGRIESYLGNAAYLAIYMFFHIFIVCWLFVSSRVTFVRVLYVLLAVLFTFTLFESGTRGTALGLLTGSTVMVLYIAIFGARFPEFRKFAIGACTLLLVVVGTFYAVRDTEFIQSSPNFARIANIDLASDLKVRGTIWGMAIEGVKERPILGWGQGNFNYIFNTQYDPFLYNQEQWFDRVHNIFIDWLVAGGVLGLFAYLSLFAACLYYLVVVPLRRPDDQTFTVLERGVLLGMLAGYVTHNFVVFDNIVSYIFFAVVLGLIHSRVGLLQPTVEKFKIHRSLFNQFIAPVAAVMLVALIYTLHIPSMQAAKDIIEGYRAASPAGRLDEFKQALSRESFAHQEITEQISQQAMGMMQDEKVPAEIKQSFVSLAETELNRLVTEKPGDARVHVFFSTFYRAIGNYDGAEVQMNFARDLSPRKPSIIMQQAIIKYAKNDIPASLAFFKEAYELDTRNEEAREYYAAVLFANGSASEAKALVAEPAAFEKIALSDFYVRAVNDKQDIPYLIELYTVRVAKQPSVAQNWASLSFLYYQSKDTAKAVETLTKASEVVPTFKKSATCFITNIEAGKDPQVGC